MKKFAIVTLTVLLVACAASSPPRDRVAEMAVYDRHAGATESWVRYARIRNWWPVGLNSVVFEMGPSRHYLVELIGSCDLDLDRAMTLRVVNRRRNVLEELDRIIVNDRPCQVQSIRRLDFDAVKAEIEASDGTLPAGYKGIRIETADQASGGT